MTILAVDTIGRYQLIYVTMTPDQARKIDTALKKLSDTELEEAIRLLEELAEIAIHDWIERHPGSIKTDGAQGEDYGTSKMSSK